MSARASLACAVWAFVVVTVCGQGTRGVRRRTAVELPVTNVLVRCPHTVARVACDVWIECSVPTPLTRAGVRALCDRCTTLAEIKLALSALK